MKNKAAVELGRLGGLATKQKKPKDYYKKLSELGVKARKKKLSTENLTNQAVDVTL